MIEVILCLVIMGSLFVLLTQVGRRVARSAERQAFVEQLRNFELAFQSYHRQRKDIPVSSSPITV